MLRRLLLSCVIFPPRNRASVIEAEFPLLKVGESYINYVNEFKYLGHIVSYDMTDDDESMVRTTPN